MRVLTITDGKPGHFNQARALCSIMGWQSSEAVAGYCCKAAKGLTYMLDRLGIYRESAFRLEYENAAYDAVVAVGSASYYPAKVISRRLGIPAIALMYPRGFSSDFAHILCPAYDNPPEADNITPLPVTLSSRGAVFFMDAVDDFKTRTDINGPAVSVIIGGGNKYGDVCPRQIQTQLEQIFELTGGAKHWVTTSRRTSGEVERVVESFPFDYKLIYSREQYNPIPAFIALSERIFVTSDSASMISECVSEGRAKIEILKNKPKRKSKFDRFLAGLVENGNAHIFDGSLGDAGKKVSVKKIVIPALEKSGFKRGGGST
jgi:uncharacterized protein